MTLPIYQIDAFANKTFTGNPAAVCPLQNWLPKEVMQDIAAENNLAETAFFVQEKDQYVLRWFTPETEVELCGHATLASAHVLFNHLGYKDHTIRFFSPHSGLLPVTKGQHGITLNFPADVLNPVAPDPQLDKALGASPQATFKGKTDYMLVYNHQKEIKNLNPNFFLLNQLSCRGVIVTAPGDTVDFVSRFFAPQCGILEDPVTGSAHTTMTPFWAQKLGKNTLQAHQLSKRGGSLQCILKENRVYLTGKAVTYLKGQIKI